MLDINFIRENPDIVKQAAANKGFTVDIDRILLLDTSLRELTQKSDNMRSERNRMSKLIPTCKDAAEKQNLTEQVRALKTELTAQETSVRDMRKEFEDLMLCVPSIPAPEVPFGKGEEDNVELRRVGTVREFDFAFKDHVELCELHDMIDVPRATKIAGSRSYFLKNHAVILEMAVSRFVIDFLTARGFTAMTVPHMVKEKAMRGTGYFPIGRDQA